MNLDSLGVICKNCNLCKFNNDIQHHVWSDGPYNSKIMFIGQNPGKDEVKTGKPFMGAAGGVFARVLSTIELKREEVYVTNSIKCYTQGNIAPTEEQLKNCKQFLEEEIDIVRPKVIVTLGSSALVQISGFTPMMAWRGGTMNYMIRGNTYLLYFMLHPASIIYDRKKVELFNQDIVKLKEIVDEHIRKVV